ncbi:hypothetical protein OESDEN_05649 [Oesophagostomum dentatum]|uniref:Uncharacterized protein n=1 Tax=Oesophagostomum dentatum TaxID=61180 RepID=A0A0B1TA16_OESDE|nr:hypothetical protein OESDEN_05649 [Oesophagostomum dentatum]
MSIMRRVFLEWSCDKSDLPNSVIIKVPCTAKVSDAFEKSSGKKTSKHDMDLMQKTMHGTETKFYRLMQAVDHEPLLVPIIYAAIDCTSEDPVIVMEDYHDCFVVKNTGAFTEKQVSSYPFYKLFLL